MRKELKKLCAAFTAAVVTAVCCVPAFAANVWDFGGASGYHIEYSHIEFVKGVAEEEGISQETVAAKIFARDYSGKENPPNMALIIAAYSEEGVLLDVGCSSGMNRTIVTSPIKTAEAKDIKAYLFDSSNYAPVMETLFLKSNGNELDEDTVKDSLTVYIDGEEYDNFIPWQSEYNDIPIHDSSLSGIARLPEITVKSTNPSVYSEVVNDAANFQIKINVYYGMRTDTKKSIKSTVSGTEYSAERTEGSKPFVTYTFNCKNPGIYSHEELSAVSDVNGPVGGAYSLDYAYEQTIDPGEAETIKFNGTRQRYVIIVKPEDETDGKDALVNPDGSAITWTKDTGVRMGFDEEKAEMLYGEMGNGAVQVNGGNASAFRQSSGSDDKYISGMRLASDRTPSTQGIHMRRLTPDLEGYNYIAGPTSDGQSVTLRVSKRSKLIYLRNEADSTAESNGWMPLNDSSINKTAIGTQAYGYDDNTQCYAYAGYGNTFTPWLAAHMIRKYGYTTDDFVKDGTNNVPTADGQQISGVTMYRPVKWETNYDAVRFLTQIAPNPDNGVSLVSSNSAAAQYKTLDDALMMYRPEFVNMSEGFSDLKMDVSYQLYSAVAKAQKFPLDENTGLFPDRAPLNDLKTGLLLSWDNTLELENTAMIVPAIGWKNNSADYREAYVNPDVKTPWYSFTVERDSEIMILSTETPKFTTEAGSGWVNSEVSGIDEAVVFNINITNGEKMSFGRISCKKFKKGEKVQIYTPQNQAMMMTFIKPLPSASEEVGSGKGISDVISTYPVDGTANTATKSLASAVGSNFHSRPADVTGDEITGRFTADNGKPDLSRYGSRFLDDRDYPVNANYPNEVISVPNAYSELLGGEYIQSCVDSFNPTLGHEISFRLYRDATVAVFAISANKDAAVYRGWNYKYLDGSGDYGACVAGLDNPNNLSNVFTKHFTVSDKENGDLITIPREMLLPKSIDKVSKDESGNWVVASRQGTYFVLPVIAYD